MLALSLIDIVFLHGQGRERRIINTCDETQGLKVVLGYYTYTFYALKKTYRNEEFNVLSQENSNRDILTFGIHCTIPVQKIFTKTLQVSKDTNIG